MNAKFGFLKTTIIGGFVFLVPFIIVVAIFGKAFQLMRKVAEPISVLFPVDSVGDIAIVNLLAIILIVAICFLAGLVARASLAGRLVQVLEARFLEHLPIYSFVKGMTASVAGSESGKELTAVLARLDDYWQVAFEVERLEGGRRRRRRATVELRGGLGTLAARGLLASHG